jgi:hypothetical protein
LRRLWIRLPTDRAQAAVAVVRVSADEQTLAMGGKAAQRAAFRNVHRLNIYH